MINFKSINFFLVKLLSLGISFALIISFLAKYIPSKKVLVFGAAGIFHPWIVIVACICLMFWLFNKKIKWVGLIIVMLLIHSPFVNQYFHFKSSIVKDTEAIKVVSYNVKMFSNHSKDSIFNLIKSLDPDIVILQEIPKNAKKHSVFTQNALKTLGLKHAYSPLQSTSTIFSNYPIKNKSLILYPSSSTLVTDIEIGEKNLQLLGIHLRSNNITRDLDSLKSVDIKSNFWNKTKNMLSIVTQNDIYRQEQMTLILDQIDTSKPTLMVGDFNTVPHSVVYNNIKEKGYNDIFETNGKGFGFTYADFPMLRIDYAFANDHIQPIGADVISDAEYSDHYPILYQVQLK